MVCAVLATLYFIYRIINPLSLEFTIISITGCIIIVLVLILLLIFKSSKIRNKLKYIIDFIIASFIIGNYEY